jgi:hypothetical protein
MQTHGDSITFMEASGDGGASIVYIVHQRGATKVDTFSQILSEMWLF